MVKGKERIVSGWLVLGLGAALVGCKGSSITAQAKTDRKVSLVVYSNGFGMVNEVRPSKLSKGRTLLSLPDISSELDPSSILLSWPKVSGDQPLVASTVYQSGASDANQVLKRFEGREVDLVLPSNTGHEGDRLKGVLESGTSGNLVIRSGDQYYVNPQGTIVATSSTNLPIRSSLRAEIETTRDRDEELGFSYLSRGLAWSADYVARELSEDEMSLECLASVTNRTGVDFPDAEITFVAGGPNVAVESDRQRQQLEDMSGFATAKTPAHAGVYLYKAKEMQAAPVGDLVSYKANSKASILNGETNRVTMFTAPKVKVAKRYSTQLPDLNEWSYYEASGPKRLTITMAVEFANEQGSGLGRRLPSGTVRLYNQSSGTNPVYIGASSMADTEVGGKLSLTMSNAFDVSAETKSMRITRPDKKIRRYVCTYTLSNQKDKEIAIDLTQNVYGTWKVVDEPVKHTVGPSNQVHWKVPMPAKTKKTFTYTIDCRA